MTVAERYAIAVRRVSVEGEELWRATVRELPDVAEFAASREEAIDLMVDAIETLREAATEEGREFPEPIADDEDFSGRVTLRMPKSLHREVAMRAELEGASINTYIILALAKKQEQVVKSGQTADVHLASIKARIAAASSVAARHRIHIESPATDMLNLFSFNSPYEKYVNSAITGLIGNSAIVQVIDREQPAIELTNMGDPRRTRERQRA